MALPASAAAAAAFLWAAGCSATAVADRQLAVHISRCGSAEWRMCPAVDAVSGDGGSRERR